MFLSRDEMKCYICKNVGHIAKKCPNFNNDEEIITIANVHTDQGAVNTQNITLSTDKPINYIDNGNNSDGSNLTKLDSLSYSKKRPATSSVDLDKISIESETNDHTEKIEVPNLQPPHLNFTQTRKLKKAKQDIVTSDSSVFSEFKDVFVNKDISFDLFCKFLIESKGKQDVLTVAKNLNFNIDTIFNLLVGSIHTVKTNSLKARLKRITKKN